MELGIGLIPEFRRLAMQRLEVLAVLELDAPPRGPLFGGRVCRGAVLDGLLFVVRLENPTSLGV